MKNNKVKYLVLGIALISVIGAAILLNQEQTLKAGENVYRPIWGSLGCEPTGDIQLETRYFDAGGKIEYICQDTGCQIADLTIANGCKNLDVFGQQIITGFDSVTIKVDGVIDRTCDSWSLSDWKNCNNPPIVVGQGSVLTIEGHCWIGTPYTGIAKGVLRYSSIELIKYQEGGKFDVSGGQHCYTASVKQSLSDIQTSEESKLSIWKSLTTKNILGEVINSYTPSNSISSFDYYQDGAEYVPLGKYVPYLVELRKIDVPLNIYTPSSGVFANKEIVCDTALTKVYQLEYVYTNSGSYKIPTKDLGSVECCTNADCYSSGQVCDTSSMFKCVDSGVQSCISDLQCGDVVGRDSGGTYVKDGRCVGGRCQYTTSYVDCLIHNDCPSRPGYSVECSNYNCLYTSNSIKVPCPSSSCCTGNGAYYSKDCEGNQVCCSSNGVIGTCKLYSCDAVCQTDSDCNDGNANTVDKCVNGNCQHIKGGSCEAQCTITISTPIGNYELRDYLCYLSCIIENAINGVVEVTVTLMKLIVDLILSFFVGVIVWQQSTKGRKNKDKTAEFLLSLLSVFLSSYVLWMLFGVIA